MKSDENAERVIEPGMERSRVDLDSLELRIGTNRDWSASMDWLWPRAACRLGWTGGWQRDCAMPPSSV